MWEMVNGEWSGVHGLSQAAIGRAMDLSPAAITKLKKQGMPVDSVENAAAWRMARQNVAARKAMPAALHHHTATPAAHRPAPAMPAARANDESHDQARTRREITEANLAELKLAELRGDLIRREDMERAVGALAAGLRESVLQIKARLAPLLAAESDIMKISAMLDAELRAALNKAVG